MYWHSGMLKLGDLRLQTAALVVVVVVVCV